MDTWSIVNGKLVNQLGERKSRRSGAQEGNCVVVSEVGSQSA